MKPSDVFGIVVRTVGLVITLTALWTIGGAFLNVAAGGPRNVAGLLIPGIVELVIGLWLLRGAKALVQFAFPEES